MTYLDRLLQQQRMKRVVPLAVVGARVLDIGCADGVLRPALAHIGSYVGIDPDLPHGSSLPGVQFIRATFPTATLPPSETFDLVVALAIMEHVPIAAQPDFARSCAERVAPGGRLAITVPSPFVDVIIGGLKALRLLDGMHEEQHYGFDPAAVPPMFEAQGLVLDRHERFELGLNHLFVFRRPAVG